MYGKIIDKHMCYASKNFKTEDGDLIINFNKNIELMKKYGFKEVIEDKPDHNTETQYLEFVNCEELEDRIVIHYRVANMIKDSEPSIIERVENIEKTNKKQDELINDLKKNIESVPYLEERIKYLENDMLAIKEYQLELINLLKKRVE